jgi:phosphate/sulfate permease
MVAEWCSHVAYPPHLALPCGPVDYALPLVYGCRSTLSSYAVFHHMLYPHVSDCCVGACVCVGCYVSHHRLLLHAGASVLHLGPAAAAANHVSAATPMHGANQSGVSPLP